MRYVIALGLALILNAGANLLMKVGMKSVHASGGILKEGVFAAIGIVLSSSKLLIGLTCFALNAMFYMYALQSPALKISMAYPIMVGGGYALIALIAHFHPSLAESLTSGQKIGVLLVLTGIVVITWQSPVTNH